MGDDEVQDGGAVSEVVVRTVPFADTLQRLRSGAVSRELADAMQELVESVMDTHRAGTLTLQLKVSKSKATGMVEIADTVAVKLPKADRAVSMFFVTDDHNLSRTNPHQDELPGVRVVPADESGRPKRVGE